MPISALPTPPTRSDPASFAARGDAFLSALPTFASEANALAGTVNGYEAAAAASAAAASGSSGAAASQASASAASATLSAASAAFKGAWSSLTGALAVPASCHHAGRYWMLLANVADVAAHTPGVSASWQAINLGFAWVDKSTTYSAASNDGVRVSTASGAWTLTLPPAPAIGEEVAVLDVGHALAANPLTIARNGLLIMGLAEDMTVTATYAAFVMHYSGTTKGWVLR